VEGGEEVLPAQELGDRWEVECEHVAFRSSAQGASVWAGSEVGVVWDAAAVRLSAVCLSPGLLSVVDTYFSSHISRPRCVTMMVAARAYNEIQLSSRTIQTARKISPRRIR